MKVKEVMAKTVKSISPQTSAKEALDTLFDLQISGLPVIDHQGKLVGMFTEKDILRYMLPSYVENVGSFMYAEDPKWIKNKAADLTRVKVDAIMRKEVVTIDEEASLSAAARIMLTQKARRIPVLDKQGRVVGIVARQDILKGLFRPAQEAKS